MASTPTLEAEAHQAGPAIRNIRSVNAIFILILAVQFTSVIFYNSQILKFFGEGVYIALNRSLYITAGTCLTLGVLCGEFLSVAISTSLFIYFCVTAYWGTKYSGISFENSLILSFTALSSAPIFSYLIKKLKFPAIRHVIIFSTLLYLSLYIFVSIAMPGAEARMGSGNGFIAASGDREARIFLDTGAASLAFFLGLSGLRHREGVYLNLAALCMSMIALYLSHSRLIEVRTALCAILYLVTRDRRLTAYLFWFIFLCGTIYLLTAVALGQNIYDYTSYDPSSLARAKELRTAMLSFDEYYFYGTGIYNPLTSLQPNAGVDYGKIVFWNDLGIYGVLYAAGILGVAIYAIMATLMIFSQQRFDKIGIPGALADGIGMAAINIAFASFAVTTLWDCGLEIFTIVIAALSIGRFHWRGRPRG